METNSHRYLPVLPIRNTVLFPGTAVPLRVGRSKSVAAVEAARRTDGYVVVIAQKPKAAKQEKSEFPEVYSSDLFRVGVIAKLERVRGDQQNGFQVLVRAVHRFKAQEFRENGSFIEVLGDQLPDKIDADPATQEALLDSLKSLSHQVLELLPADTSQLSELVDGIQDVGYLSNLAASNLELTLEKKQQLLETVSLKARVLALLELMAKQKDALEVQGEIRDKMSHRMGKLQREAILREQLKAIREELGEGGEEKAKEDYREKIEKAGMPEDVRKVALEELKRLETVGSSSPETHVIRNYLDLLVAMPWSTSTAPRSEELDLERARAILDEDHYGLDKIKARIIQHLAVMKLKKSAGSKGSVLLFVGPPGVGKTSLGKSIARALGRKFVRGALGGVRDDAEIRGHRRTYIGAMPGRIIQGIKRAGANDGVFMLDEIDKLARGYSGDPAGALLEVLDPAQNSSFLDHYLDVPFDLSKVFFIATANSLESIPAPLLDRMEVIELNGYTTAEKLHIARNHLIPRQLEEHGMSQEKSGAPLRISDEALLRVISHYTREAGVRDLERKIAALCRGSTERVLAAQAHSQSQFKESPEPVVVEPVALEEILGPERFIHEVAERISPPGVVTGLAWTPQGGEILFIEATRMPGSGKLMITGQLGEVMKESAQIALSLVRSRMSQLIPGFEFEKNDVHIHVPAGAIPKDGPSAGVAMVSTIASLFAGRSVNPKLAMTGEVTLRGSVMPVGGIKEKVIAAHRAGIERVILPRRNQKDLRDVPQEVKDQLKIEFVDTVTDVLRTAVGLDGEDLELRVSTDRAAEAPLL
jgi:ATP-dependent Lon protease